TSGALSIRIRLPAKQSFHVTMARVPARSRRTCALARRSALEASDAALHRIKVRAKARAIVAIAARAAKAAAVSAEWLVEVDHAEAVQEEVAVAAEALV